MDLQTLAADLISRTEKAVEQIAGLSAHTGITFKVTDVVDAVERDLPADYPAPTTDGSLTRRDVIKSMAEDILSGAIYEDHA
jgi:glycerol kinase